MSTRSIRAGGLVVPGTVQPFDRPAPGFVSLCLVLVTLAAATGCADSGGPGNPMATLDQAFGHPDSVLLWSEAEKRAGFPRYDEIFPSRRIDAGAVPRPLPDLSDGLGLDASTFMEENHQVGLMVVRGGEVLLEAYAGGHGPDQPWVSYSVAKSVVSLLMGAALKDGYIGGLDDPVTDYVPLLRDGAYEGVSIRDVLRMSSGVAWNEDYGDPDSDVSREIDYGAAQRLAFLSDRPRVAEPGTRFNYSTGEIFLAGAVVRGAVGNNLSSYLAQKIWGPYGMESDASWMLVEAGGAEYAGCCISATLRDYARLGTFVLDQGVTPSGHHVLPEGWVAESTTPSPANPEYGYLWWLHEDGSFSARGIFGQLIHVDPALDLVVAMHGLWPEPVSEELSSGRDRFLAQVKAGSREGSSIP